MLISMEEYLYKLTENREAVERYMNPIKSDFQKNMESRGWEYLGNELFYSMMDDMEPLELVWGEEIILARNTLREKMRMKIKEIHRDSSVEKVRFTQAYNTSGKRLPKEKLAAGVYIKRKVS